MNLRPPHMQFSLALVMYSCSDSAMHLLMQLERCCIILGRAWGSSKLHLKCPHRHAALHEIFVQPDYYGYTGYGVSFIVKPWASKRIPAMYERSCQALTWNKLRHRTDSLSLAACLAGITRDRLIRPTMYHTSESTLPRVLPTHST